MSVDLDRRLSSGVSLREAILTARTWWDREGRHVVRNPFWRDPDNYGLPSGITRGLPFDELTREEQAKVVRVHHDDKLLPMMVAPDPIQVAVDKANAIYRERVAKGMAPSAFTLDRAAFEKQHGRRSHP